MWSSDLKAALRNIFRNKVPSAISILGMGIGLGCIIILLALILHERSFDKFIPGYRNVYRIVLGSIGQTPYPLAETMAGEFPEVKGFFRYHRAMSLQIKTHDNEIIRESDFGFADPSIYMTTGIKFLSGVPAASLTEVAISEEAAMKYFGELSPVGLVLPVKFENDFSELTVTGVFKDFPSNSTLYPSFIADIKLSQRLFTQFQKTLGDFGSENTQTLDWKDTEYLSFLVLDKNAKPEALALKMEKYKEFLTIENKDELHYRLQPVAEMYLGSEGISGIQFMRQGNPEELVYYEVISLLILIISVANYVLLTRAGVAERIHDLGTRKVFGASHAMVRRLIVLESNIVVLLSLIPASFVIDFGIKFVNDSLNKTMTSQIFLDPVMWILLAIIVIFTGTVSGWLIGLYYSRIPALKLITGKINKSGRPGRWNYSFLIVHFTIFMILVSGVIAVSKQIRYSRSEFRGIRPENILVAELPSDNLMKSYFTIKDEIERVPGVVAAAGGSFIPPFGYFLPVNLKTTDGGSVRLDGLIMGEGMTELLGLEIIDGTSFGPYKTGIPEVIINESSAREHKVRAGDKLLAFMVKGVVKDFHAHSLHTAIQPMVILQQNPERMRLIAVKTDGSNDEVVRKRMKELFNQISPDDIFEARYLTDRIDNFYVVERNQSRIIGVFAMLATILSVMGLFGISLITISRKSREIGLRKVNGASIGEILLVVNSGFIKWVIISIVISVPVSIYLLNQWLERFAYKTQLSWWIFALATVAAILVAVITVSWQSLRAATSNPVEAIRYE